MAYENDTALVYDLYCLPITDEAVGFWTSLAGPGARHLLEPMIGTAELALALARRGFRVTGVDLSPAMLEAAARKKDLEPFEVAARLSLIEGDMAVVALPEESFDLAYVTSGSWNLIVDENTRVQALKSIRRSLKPGRVFAADLYPPFTRGGKTEPHLFRPIRPVPDRWDVFKKSQMERDPDSQIVHIREELSINGRVSHHSLTLQALWPLQYADECRRAGFGEVRFYGGHDLRPYVEGGDLMALAERE